MLKDIAKMIALQEVDIRIDEVRKSSKELPARTEELEKQVAGAKSAVAGIEAAITNIIKEKESVIEKAEEAKKSLSKSQERLNAITTNREYDAVHSEIESNKRLVADSEHRTADLDKEIEKQNEALAAAKQESEKVAAENGPKIMELKNEIATIDSKVAAIEIERAAILPGIGKYYLRMYEQIRKRRKKANVLSLVNDLDRACSVCHKMMEVQLFNEIRKGDRLETCQGCGSILVWENAAQQVNGQQPGGAQ